MSAPLRPALFLDRDGTLNHEVNYLDDPEKLVLIPGAAEAIALARSQGWLTIVITNQAGVGRGYFSLDQLHAVNDKLHADLESAGVQVDGLYFCPHHPDDQCPCRKPNPGMLETAARDHDIDLARSWMIGDNLSDLGAGRNAGCRTALVLTGHGSRSKESGATADIVADSVLHAVQRILGLESER